MKKLFMFFIAVLACGMASAKVWRLNPSPNAKADFSTFKEACEATDNSGGSFERIVKDGDTLYCEPGYYEGSSTDNTITIPVTVIGPGWGFESAYGSTSTAAAAQFKNAVSIKSDNVTFQGIYCSDYLYCNSKSCVIKRCRVRWMELNGSRYIQLLNNYVESIDRISDVTTIMGNIILSRVAGYGTNVRLQNNTIVSGVGGFFIVDLTGAQIYDNIIINTGNPNHLMSSFTNADNLIKNNVFSITVSNEEIKAVTDKYPENKFLGATLENTFTCDRSVTIDAFYQLLPACDAKGYASDGGDCGAFGGPFPYIIHCRPMGVPYIYDVQVSEYPTNDVLNISFKVKGQNE